MAYADLCTYVGIGLIGIFIIAQLHASNEMESAYKRLANADPIPPDPPAAKAPRRPVTAPPQPYIF